MSLLSKGLRTTEGAYIPAPSVTINSHQNVANITSLGELNLGEQLLLQLKAVTKLQDEALADSETPVNQKAQLMNSCNQLIRALVKMKTTLYNADRIRIMESILIDTLKDMCGSEVQEAFISEYERRLSELRDREESQEMEGALDDQ